MNSSEYNHINDELLSAYLDDAITDQERLLVEAALATDRNIAWRLETLKHTVLLLNGLPELAVPRSFALQEAQVGDVLSERRLRTNRLLLPADTPSTVSERLGNFQQAWRSFWQSGNPMLRNAAAVCLILLLVLVGSDVFLKTSSLTATQPQMAVESYSAAPADADLEGSAADTVAMAEREPAQSQLESLPEPAAAEEEAADSIVIIEAGDEVGGSAETQTLAVAPASQEETVTEDDTDAGEMAFAATLAPQATPVPDAAAGAAVVAASPAEPSIAQAGEAEGASLARSAAALSSRPEAAAVSEAPVAADAQLAVVEEEVATAGIPMEDAAAAVPLDAPLEAEQMEESVREEAAAAPEAAQAEAAAPPEVAKEDAPTISAQPEVVEPDQPNVLPPATTLSPIAPAMGAEAQSTAGLPSPVLLQLAQLALVLLTVALTLLWWRSRSSAPSP